MFYMQFLVWCCYGCSIAPLTDYNKNLIFQELLSESDYFSMANKSIHLDLRDSMGYTSELAKLRQKDRNLILDLQPCS